MTWAQVLCEITDAAPISRLALYFATYSGRGFDRIAMEGPPDRFTASDLYACGLLSAEIDPRTGADLLDQYAERCARLLRAIPSDVSIRDDRSAMPSHQMEVQPSSTAFSAP